MPRKARKATIELNPVAAGKVIEKRILQQEATVTRWVRLHTNALGMPMGITTVNRICDGLYNPGSDASLRLLWRLCRHLTESDQAAQMLACEYLTAYGIIPHSAEISIASQLAALRAPLERAARATVQLAAGEKQKAKKRKRETRTPPPDDVPVPEPGQGGDYPAR